MKLTLEIDNVGETLSQIGSAYLEQANPSALLSRIARVMTTQGEPTIGAMLDTMSRLMREAEHSGKTIALNGDHFALTAFVSYDDAATLADKGFCTLGGKAAR